MKHRKTIEILEYGSSQVAGMGVVYIPAVSEDPGGRTHGGTRLHDHCILRNGKLLLQLDAPTQDGPSFAATTTRYAVVEG